MSRIGFRGLLRFLAGMDLHVNLLRPECQQEIKSKPYETCNGHDNENEPVTVSSYTSIAPSTCLSRLSIIQEPSKEPREEEGTQWEIKDENVVDETIIL